MTRSDLLIAVHKHLPDDLIFSMYEKIEAVYKIVFVLEKDENKEFHALAAILRKALEK